MMASSRDRFGDSHEYTGQLFKAIESPQVQIYKTVFTTCRFQGCDFSEGTFKHCLFDNCDFVQCTFSMAHFPDSRLTECHFTNCQLKAIDWSDFKSRLGLKLHCTDCDLSYSVFPGVTLSESVFKRCKMLEVEFAEAIASKCDFRHSDLERARFHRTDLRECDFRGAVNYLFNPADNKCKNARFNYPEVLALVKVFGVKIEDPLIEEE